MRPAEFASICLAALAAFLPSQARAQEWGELSRDYSRLVVALLETLPSTRRHAAFLLEKRIDLTVTDSPTHVDDNILGAYDFVERRIYVDEVRLLNGAEELLNQGVPRKDAAEILAWKTLPTIVHEATHAMTHHAVERGAGRRLLLYVLEDELLAFYDELLALHELLRRRPGLWREDRILSIERSYGDILRDWNKGGLALERRVMRLYDGVDPLLTTPLPDLLGRLDGDIRELKETLEDLRRLARQGDEHAVLEREALARRTFRSLAEMVRYAQAKLELNSQAREALSEPKSYRRLKDFYRAELRERLERLERRRREVQ